MAALAQTCLAPLAESTSEFAYEQVGGYRFLETGVVSMWMDDGKSVSRASAPDSVSAATLVRYEVHDARVSYLRESRSTLERTVDVRLSGLRFENGVATVSVAECPGTFTDIVDRNDIEAIEDAGIQETRGIIPRSGFLKRYGQPIVAGAASAVAVYLFFSIRSDEASN
ncbi:MAG: hypothetical protein HKN43_17070 [Rhodothermales bacterium]|nr:hypothetical protein [Rhodothermales bacterium]